MMVAVKARMGGDGEAAGRRAGRALCISSHGGCAWWGVKSDDRSGWVLMMVLRKLGGKWACQERVSVVLGDAPWVCRVYPALLGQPAWLP